MTSSVSKLHVDLGLAGGGHLVVLDLDLDAEALHGEDHLGPQVLEVVGRRDREVPLLGTDLVAEVRSFVGAGVPVPLDRVHLVEGVALVLGVPHVVEDEELGLGPEVTGVGQPGGAEVRLGLRGHVAGVTRIRLEGHRVADEAVDVQGPVLPERVDDCGVGVGHEQHVRLLDLLEPPDRGSVEPEALLEDVLGQLVGGDREMLHEAGEVDEPDVDDLDALVLQPSGALPPGSASAPFLLGQFSARLRRREAFTAAPWWWLARPTHKSASAAPARRAVGGRPRSLPRWDFAAVARL